MTKDEFNGFAKSLEPTPFIPGDASDKFSTPMLVADGGQLVVKQPKK